MSLAQWLQHEPAGHTAVLDFTTSVNYVKRHIPGTWFVLRSELEQAVARIPTAQRYVLTCGSSLLARYAATELTRLTAAVGVVGLLIAVLPRIGELLEALTDQAHQLRNAA